MVDDVALLRNIPSTGAWGHVFEYLAAHTQLQRLELSIEYDVRMMTYVDGDEEERSLFTAENDGNSAVVAVVDEDQGACGAGGGIVGGWGVGGG